MYEGGNSSDRSAHLLRRPYENVVAAGIQPLRRRRTLMGWMRNSSGLPELLLREDGCGTSYMRSIDGNEEVHMLKDKKAVIFDLDGTLVDSMWVWSQIDIDYLGLYGYPVPGDLQGIVEGMGFTEVAAYFKERFRLPDTIDAIKKTWQDMAMDKYCTEVPLKTGVAEFLPYLKEHGISMAVASSNACGLIEAVLKSHGIREYFEGIITACEVNKGKPAPDVYLEAARRIGVKPGDCLVFEDIVAGIQAGKAAGMDVCAVSDHYSIHQEKEKRQCADYYIDSYEQVMTGTYEEI